LYLAFQEEMDSDGFYGSEKKVAGNRTEHTYIKTLAAYGLCVRLAKRKTNSAFFVLRQPFKSSY
jgi:hypothetical protein